MQKIIQVLLFSAFIISLLSCTVQKRTPSVDHYYVINKHQMHLSIQGSGDTLIFGAGSGIKNPTKDFSGLTSILDKNYQTVVYDRPGFGKSKQTSTPRDVQTVTTELHSLFDQAKLKKPYVFVGHSISSLEILHFAQKYPNEVKAIILIEGTPPELLMSIMNEKMLQKARIEYFFGLMKKATFLESMWWSNNAKIIEKNGLLNNIPILYICRENTDTKWLNNYSTNVTIKYVSTKQHSIHRYEPEVVTNDIKSFLTNIE